MNYDQFCSDESQRSSMSDVSLGFIIATDEDITMMMFRGNTDIAYYSSRCRPGIVGNGTRIHGHDDDDDDDGNFPRPPQIFNRLHCRCILILMVLIVAFEDDDDEDDDVVAFDDDGNIR